MRASGTGPGDIAPDGSAVEFYAALPPDTASAALVHAAIPDGASILELGAGTGRVTHPLLDLGHPVVAVDDSAAMLARIEGARTVRSRIEDLALPETFDAVLLMSFLIGYGDRRVLLDACRRHLAPSGHVIVQRESPEMFATAAPSTWERDGVRYRMHDVSRPEPGILSAAIEYRMGDRTWTHRFTSRHLGDEELPAVLAASGLRLDRYLDEARGWILASPL
ncbi:MULTISPECIES: class I SAM-dependent methyltransferase [Thermomonosporaceae]|uniref:class I SAM-dependent methyltransferase n=1 Tax=Thermomonosporaceae TaxID=2012 RepID=UPI00255B2F25|nr:MULTISPECIES: class I SAM-dependent methyltransferase [Thermomonosporaceae]MDL4771069.1 class I SAM-dependent methyltransferase [Actinomadura xylanilytica]